MDPLDRVPLDALDHRAPSVGREVVLALVVGETVVEHEGVALSTPREEGVRGRVEGEGRAGVRLGMESKMLGQYKRSVGGEISRGSMVV